MLWAEIAIILILFVITYEDFKDRSVHFFLFPLLAGLLIYASLQRTPLEVIAVYAGFNILYLALIMISCLVYVYLRYKSFAVLKYIGIGDILFFLIVALWFEPISFIVFNTITFIVALVLHFLFSRASAAYIRFKTVPLAGFQSVCFAMVILYSYISTGSYG